MKLIKLDAIDSTNSFLKELCKHSALENYTTVVTNNQLQGRGQMNATWFSEPYKNLTFSTLINNIQLPVADSKYLNFVASLAVFKTLNHYNLPNLKIKWPNDILSDHQKVCGILVENTFTASKIKNCIIGIGLNVHQIEFNNLPKVSSLQKITGRKFDLDKIRTEILQELQALMTLIHQKEFATLENNYLEALYQKDISVQFQSKNGLIFYGTITGISKQGHLIVAHANGQSKEYGIKEIKFL